jgi:hypothetical protein
MKLLRAALLASSAVLVASAFAEPARASVSFEFAYSNLSQHGSWLVSAQYGRVWQPREYARDWNPYYDGHWVDTDMGWTWVSDYGWGSTHTLGFGAVALVLLASFLARQLTAANPLLPLRVLRSRGAAPRLARDN